MIDILIYLVAFGTLFMPYIIGIIICLIRKKLIRKDKKLRILIYVIILIFCVLVSRKLGYSFMLYASAKPDKIYVEMNEMNNNQSLIGLSKEQVVSVKFM